MMRWLQFSLVVLSVLEVRSLSSPPAASVSRLRGVVEHLRSRGTKPSQEFENIAYTQESASEALGGWRSWSVLGVVVGFLAFFNQRAGHQLELSGKSRDTTRRACLSGMSLGASIVPLSIPAAYAEEEELVEVYFGCGCFWHVQHEFVEAEKNILGRGASDLSAFVGYAGGKAGAKDGKVCYHNAVGVSDYGSLGHAEVVCLRVPPSKFGPIAEEYCKLFSSTGERPDQNGDRGPEYRNLVGFPGGMKSPLAKKLVEASEKQGDKLDFAIGKGDDKDVKATVFVMDTSEFPFFIGEPYHQFHDGFAWGEDYPDAYNSLGANYLKSGGLKASACPNGMLGIGIAGL